MAQTIYTVSVRMPAEMESGVRRLAELKNLSINQLIIRILAKEIQRQGLNESLPIGISGGAE